MYPNIVPAESDTNGLTLSPFMRELIYPLALQHPDWVFEMRPQLSSFSVECVHVHTNTTHKEYLGRIRTGRRADEVCYFITNRRIQLSRQRGENIITRKLKVAIQTVKKYFCAPPIEERIDKAWEVTMPKLQMHRHGKRRRMEDAKGDIDDELQKFLTTHWSMFVNNLPTDKQLLAEAYLNATKEYSETKSVVDAAQSKNIVTVLTVDDNYVVQFGGVIKTMRSEELDPELRQRIGTLKLLQQGSVVHGVGFRSQPDFFMVIPPEGFSI